MKSAGHTCVFSSDLDKDARETYLNNFGNSPHGDITKINSEIIPDHNIMCGGFPCQPFSISGNQYGFADARGTLLYEILRIAKVHSPKVLFLENVKNYLTHSSGKTLSTTIELLGSAGYDVFYKVLNASEFGIPQKRERLYFVCFRQDLRVSHFSFPSASNENVSVEDILMPSGDPILDDLIIQRNDLRLVDHLDLPRQNRPLRIGTVGKGGQGERVYSPRGHAITLSAFGGGIGAKTGMYLIDGKIRRLHPRECARLMGFPEDFKLHSRRNVCYKQFGNSVVIPVVSKIFEEVQITLNNNSQKAA